MTALCGHNPPVTVANGHPWDCRFCKPPPRTTAWPARRSLALAPPNGRRPCRHLGDALPNQGCGCGAKVRACAKFGTATTVSHILPHACCAACDDYEWPILDAEMAELDGPAVPRPKGWASDPVVREAHRQLMERFVEERLPGFPERKFAGRGVVLVGGGKYEAGIYVALKMLRHFGCTLPVDVWHRGDAEPLSAKVRDLPGVDVIDGTAHPAAKERRILNGWEMKHFAIIHSRFAEVLYIDADAYPVGPVDALFDGYDTAVFWPDTPATIGWTRYESYGLTRPPGPPVNGGHYVIDKAKAWKALQLAAHLDDHSDFWYQEHEQVGGYGDQSQLMAAWRRFDLPSTRYADDPGLAHDCFVQAGPDLKPLFVHRCNSKFGPPGAFRAMATVLPLPGETLAWQFFREWEAESDG